MFNNKLYQVVCLGLFAGAAALAQAPPTGTITGTVYDAQTGRPISGVVVAVDGQVDLANVTDSTGSFRIRTSPGDHTLKMTAENYVSTEVSVPGLMAGEVKEASTVMSNQSMVQSIDVSATLDNLTSTEEAMLTERRLSAVVSDSIGRQELAQGTASDAAGALEKVTGVSVVGDGFVYVRGLGERYSATQLNGALVPTTEPEKRVVPLDLFPTGMIDRVNIAKTYSPDLPAEFSGGLVQLQTMEFPARSTFNISVKGGFNSVTTFGNFLQTPSVGAADFWGFGTGQRELPSIIPRDRRLFAGQFSQQELQTFGRAFDPTWEPETLTSQRPAIDWSMSGGTTLGKFGLVGALSFSNKPQVRQEVQRFFRVAGNDPFVFSDYDDFREDSVSARWGGVFNLSYRFSPSNKIAFRNTITRDTENTARRFRGFEGTSGADIVAERLRFIERSVYAHSVEGEHVFAGAKNSILHWQFTFSASGRNEPDLREVIRNIEPGGRTPFTAGSSSGIRFFSDMRDKIYEPQADYSVPFYKGPVAGLFRVGFRSSFRRRDFGARRFRYIPINFQTINRSLPSNQLLVPENIRPDGFEITEYTRGTDVYDAKMDLYAGYAMIDLSFGPKWRFVGGLRVEDADQEVVTIDNQIPNAPPVVASLKNTDPVPAVNLIYSLSQRQNLRASFSRTLSRPDFRELSPFDFNNVIGGYVTVGNANLRRAAINNYDVRWEMFRGGNQLLAASAFAKTFTDPIEQTVIVSNDLRQSFINAKGARNFGFELELRQGLSAVSSRLSEFSISSNFTFVDSNVQIRPEDAAVLTSMERPLVGQSRYVFNGTLQWTRPQWHSDARLFANYVSSRISDVGSYRLPDVYQQPVTTVDFVYQYTAGERGQWSYRFEAENLTNNDFRWTLGDFTQRQYRLGRTFQIGINYSFF